MNEVPTSIHLYVVQSDELLGDSYPAISGDASNKAGLTAVGIQQAKALGGDLKEAQFEPDVVYTSRDERARQMGFYTLRAVKCDSQPILDNDLQEDMPSFLSTLVSKAPIRRRPEVVLGFGHGLATRALASHLLRRGAEKLPEDTTSPASLSLFTYQGGEWRCEYVGQRAAAFNRFSIE